MRDLIPRNTKIITSTSTSTSIKKSLLTSDEQAWTTTSLPSYIHLIFNDPIPNATHVALTFQGGFAATSCMIYCAMKPAGRNSDVVLGLSMGGRIHPEDKNRRQVFEIPFPPGTNPDPVPLQTPQNTFSLQNGAQIITEIPPNPNGNGAPASPVQRVDEHGEPELAEIKIEFEASSDDYGRVTVYQVEIMG